MDKILNILSIAREKEGSRETQKNNQNMTKNVDNHYKRVYNINIKKD